MEWLNKLHGTIVGLDTAPLIYFIERHPKYLALVQPFFQAMEEGKFQVVTSTLTLTEVLVHPYRLGDAALARKYLGILLDAPNLRMLGVSSAIADDAARIRATYSVKTPDAIQLAAARAGKAAIFLTNDEGMAAIPGLQIVVLDKLLVNPRP